MATFADYDAQLTGRCAQSRKVANNTYLVRRGPAIAVKLHDTDVVLFRPDDTLVLNTGGWFTVTTKERMNRFLPRGIGVSSVRGRWFLTYSGHIEPADDGYWNYVPSDRPSVPYADGIVIDMTTLDVVDGAPALDKVRAEDAANEDTRKAIERYLRKTRPEDIVKAFEHPEGDCFFCSGLLPKDDTEHLRSHLEDQYVMLSLARNAVTARGFLRPDFILDRIYRDALRGQVSPDYRDCVRKYLRKSLIRGVAVAA